MNTHSCICAPASTASANSSDFRATFQPAVDIYESQDEFVIHADVPGATTEGIEITFEDGILQLTAKASPRYTGQTPMLVREYAVADFKRSFRVGATVDASRIAAQVKHGVLTIHLPKQESARPRKIPVQNN